MDRPQSSAKNQKLVKTLKTLNKIFSKILTHICSINCVTENYEMAFFGNKAKSYVLFNFSSIIKDCLL